MCDAEQLEMVEAEYEICEKSNYTTSYCFLQAKATLCDRILND